MKIFKPPYNRGFTLAEILLSTAILVFALCGMLMMYSTCFVLMATSKNINIATNAAQGLIEEMRSSPFTQMVDDYNGLNFIVDAIPSSRGVVYVDDTDPELLQVTISVCWNQGNRIIGEDTNLNGVLNAGEDANGNGIIDSPVELVTRIANR